MGFDNGHQRALWRGKHNRASDRRQIRGVGSEMNRAAWSEVQGAGAPCSIVSMHSSCSVFMPCENCRQSKSPRRKTCAAICGMHRHEEARVARSWLLEQESPVHGSWRQILPTYALQRSNQLCQSLVQQEMLEYASLKLEGEGFKTSKGQALS